jgi:outer membrane OprD family porin
MPFCFVLVFLCQLLWATVPRPSLAQENMLDEGPMPGTVQELIDSFRKPFEKPLPLPWLLPQLRRTLHEALQWEERAEQPFFRNSALTLKLRTFYFNRDTHKANAGDSSNEAWALGGSLAYQSGWYKEFLSIGTEVFTSQKLYGPRDRDGTLYASLSTMSCQCCKRITSVLLDR